MLKAGVIGVGAMGQHHARVYAQLEDIDLVGVADPCHDSGRQIARLYHGKAYSDYQELLAEAKPDLVTIAVPTALHCEVVCAALSAGSHVLVEKPIASTEQEAWQMIDCAEQVGRVLMVGHIVRFDAAVQELKAQLDAGNLGRIFEVRCRRLGPFPPRVKDVGVIVDLATHDLDLLRYITGEEAVRVYAETEQQIHSAYEDILAGTIRLRNGIIGILDVNWLTPSKIRELTVTGERGMYLVDHLTQDLYFYENAEANGERWATMSLLRGVSEGRMIRFPVHKHEPLRAELEAFIVAVRNGTPPLVDGRDGVAALRLAEALVQSGREGRSVILAP